jgi:hypothetical protein
MASFRPFFAIMHILNIRREQKFVSKLAKKLKILFVLAKPLNNPPFNFVRNIVPL